MIKRIIVSVLLSIVVFCSTASDFTITPIGSVKHTAASGNLSPLHYKFPGYALDSPDHNM